jgi:hypothetical protein
MADNSEWTYQIDFKVTDGGWVNLPSSPGPDPGPWQTWISNTGYVANCQYVYTDSHKFIRLSLALDYPLNLTSMELVYDNTVPSGAGGTSVVLADGIGVIFTWPHQTGTNLMAHWTGLVQIASGNNLYLELRGGYNLATTTCPSGTLTLKEIVLQGICLNPFLVHAGPADCGCGVYTSIDA